MADLDRYHEKRDFEKTPEPEGATPAEGGEVDPGCETRDEDTPCEPGLAYVIHKHAARRLHYDVRLEMNGALASWAVPKGPSYDTRQKRLAVHVEDHPLEYGSFEGTIPQGEYGGGTVMVWDRGTWEAIGDLEESMASGQLKFNLHGEKLTGRWVLVRMKPKKNEKAENWLLIKEKDEYVRPAEEYDVLEARPESAASGRDMDQIAAGDAPSPKDGEPEPLRSLASPPAAAAEAPSADPASPSVEAPSGAQALPSSAHPDSPSSASAGSPSPMPGAHQGPLPADAPLQLATLVEKPPEKSEWLHEIKYDGYRLRCAVENGNARLLTRAGKDWTDRFPEIAEAAAKLPVESALLDGEAVVFGASGVPDFGSLQHALSRKDTRRVVLMTFDLLYLNGWDLLGMPLTERKELLRTLLSGADIPQFRYAEHVRSEGSLFHKEACMLALEGSVSKLGTAPYRPGRSRDWQKTKCLKRQEFIVGGYTEARGTRSGFGALLLGVKESECDLRFSGRVGTGFTEYDLNSLAERLAKLATDDSPFCDEVVIRDRTVHWVDPVLVVEVSFQDWTEDGLIRHSSFLGLREDIDAEGVVRERPVALESYSATQSDPTPATEPGPGSDVEISNPDKVLFPQLGLTKGQLAEYYREVADAILPHIARRPLTLVRCPHGRDGECFYQKHPEKKGWPSSIDTVEIAEKDGPAIYSYVDDIDGLIALVQLGTLELHAWNSLIDEPELPDRVVFDLDPGPGVDWPTVVSAAQMVRGTLSALGFESFVKTTGGKGLHVVAPIVAEYDHTMIRSFARGLVDRLASYDPDSFTAKMAKSARSGKVFIDYLRNAHGATAVCAYSTRARPGAPVSVPVTWDELTELQDPRDFDARTTPERLRRQTEDPWSGYEAARTTVTPSHFAALGVPLRDG
jgi:bifunctional non-homologous end joining protein LigD